MLDHHKTALEMLGSGTSTNGNVTKVIDMDRSGATIAYDYFKEKLLSGNTSRGIDGAVADFGRVRKLFEYIEDADLWRWSLPNSKAFSSGLKDLNLEFDFALNPLLFQKVTCVRCTLKLATLHRFLIPKIHTNLNYMFEQITTFE